MKVTKIFDCQNMPSGVKRIFIEKCKNGNTLYGNGSIVEHFVYSGNEYCSLDEFQKLNIDDSKIVYKEIEGNEVFYNLLGDDIVDDWLVEHGADIHEDVLIKLWW